MISEFKDDSLEKIKEEIIDSVLEQITKNYSSDILKNIEKERLKERIERNKLITDLETLGDVINAEEINKMTNEIYIDVLTTYGILNSICNSYSNFDSTFTSRMNSIKAKIKECNERLESCKSSVNNIYMPHYYQENFTNINNFTRERRFQTDRYGQFIPSKCYVNFPKDNTATLPLIRQDNSLRYDNTVETANISLNFQLGRGFLSSSYNSNNLEPIIDKYPDTFWENTILSDAPFKVKFGEKKPELLFLNDNYYYGVETGSLFEMRISFESVNVVNEITINPHCKYPLDLVAIRYKITDDIDEELKEIVYPTCNNKELRGATINDFISYNFKDTLLKNIYLVFNQRHYSRDVYIYNAMDSLTNELWFNNKNKNDEVLFKPNYYDRDISSVLYKNINDRVVSSKNDDLVDLITGSSYETRKILKYEYQYGFKDIGCYNNHYDRVGFLVTNPIQTNNNIRTVKINTDEVHQRDSFGNVVTDIEYYITTNNNPTNKEWIPIMPENKKEIYSEELFITSETRAYFRFQTEEIISVKKNGEPIDNQTNEYFIDTDEKTGKFFCIQIFNYDFDSIYSISYVPEDGHTEIDLNGNIVSTIESFSGSDVSTLTLKNVALLDSDYAYTAKVISSKLENYGEEINAIDVTDIERPENSFKNFDNTTNKLQFYIVKNKAIFNRDISSSSSVEIGYSHLASSIILKAILRRNTNKDGWLTPKLKNIEFNIEAL